MTSEFARKIAKDMLSTTRRTDEEHAHDLLEARLLLDEVLNIAPPPTRLRDRVEEFLRDMDEYYGKVR